MNNLISRQILRNLILIGSTALSLQACSAKSTTTAEEEAAAAGGTTQSTKTGGTTTEANALATAYPGTLALSVFPDGQASLRLAADASEGTYSEKLATADKRLRGEGSCFAAGEIAEHQAPTAKVTCYEFDSDMNPSTFADRPNQSWGTKDGTDGDGQACMVTFAKSEVDDISHKVDRALAMVQGLICAGKKDAEKNGTEVAKPEPDQAAIDLSEQINDSLPADAPISFTTAEMSAVTNDDDTITYITEIAILNPFGKTDYVTLRHTPAATEGGDESGVLTFEREPLGSKAPGYMPNDPNVADKKYDIMSINYQKSTDDAGKENVTAELTRAMVNEKYDPLDDDGFINFDVIPKEATNADIHAIKYVAFDMDPATGAGTLSYWMNPGGFEGESARGFLFSMEADDEGLIKGCGISGATQNVSIRKAASDLTVSLAPVRFWHPRGGQNTSPDKDARYVGNEGNLITEQCFSQDATTGKYKIDTAETASTRGYDVIAGSASDVRPPDRPPEPKLPPLPPPPTAPK